MPESEKYHFEISLSVLNHLGRNLYRNFITVLGEAISNSWDSDANNVWIEIDKKNSSFVIKDDGSGMTRDDFQGKFLKVGYSKRKDGTLNTDTGRPFIGAKGIGKLALLSCADKVSVFSKTIETDYTGGVIDNAGLDAAITDDLNPGKFPLGRLDFSLIKDLTEGHNKGTIIHFSNMKEHISNSIAHLRKLIAMSFKFSVIDNNFKIHVNDEQITVKDLKDLADNTQFCWVLNHYSDDFMERFTKKTAEPIMLTTKLNVKGFLGTTALPRHLKIDGTDERATVDLFVNGRLREKNILRHIPTQRIIESYLYGQIHFDEMDTLETNPFTTSREGIVEDDGNFQSLLKYLKETVLPQILNEWDKLRLERREDGDDENTKRASKKQRRAKSLYQEAKGDFQGDDGSHNKEQVDEWLDELASDAEFNITAYTDCFLSENLVRKYIVSKSIPFTNFQNKVKQFKDTEANHKAKANISFDIHQNSDEVSYLDMDSLAIIAEGSKDTKGKQSLCTDAIAYKPIRNALGHTRLLTKDAKNKLNITFKNIKDRVKTILAK